MTARGRVVVVGALEVVVVTHVERHPGPGEHVVGLHGGRVAAGAAMTQALAARAAGADVLVVGAVGDDDAGRQCVRRLEKAGVTTSVHRDTGSPTGTVHVTLDEHAASTTVAVPGANLAVPHESLTPRALQLGADDVVLVSPGVGRTTVIDTARAAQRAGARLVVHLSPFLPLPPDVVAAADPVVVDETGMRLLADSSLLPESLLVTFGPHGCRWGTEGVDREPVDEPEGDRPDADRPPVGETFAGTLAAALADGLDRQGALEAATAAATRQRRSETGILGVGGPTMLPLWM
ncbi:PfkB family carbohydrate kinase [Terracoccus luteus]|uniref:Ribokinase n=1 Tax=Terracoccus luteus TaxID=53356 RepID=A0A839PYY8_9MICO|nr:PfkB family carbohydrate kinase [Terracoccus luteus]MBB2985611.1 ribokinase [Terracoccus luteus]MCP2171263.1 ribokinase [Terracoccus luteus]